MHIKASTLFKIAAELPIMPFKIILITAIRHQQAAADSSWQEQAAADSSWQEQAAGDISWQEHAAADSSWQEQAAAASRVMHACMHAANFYCYILTCRWLFIKCTLNYNEADIYHRSI